MRSTPRFRVKFLLLTTAVLVVSACSTDSPRRSAERAPVRIEGQSEVQVAETRALPDPLEQHMRARKLVNPSNPNAPNKYAVAYVPPEYQDPKFVPAPAPGHKPMPGREYEVASVETQQVAQVGRSEVAPVTYPVRSGAVPVHRSYSSSSSVARSVSDHDFTSAQADRVNRVMPSSGETSVVALRMGDHPGKTRLVLDMSGATDYQFDLDNDKHILFIELPSARWSAEQQRVFSDHPLILAYIAKPSDKGGTLLAVKLRRDAEVLFKASYLPDQGRPHRIVFDVAAG